jgi:hypothetical protein
MDFVSNIINRHIEPAKNIMPRLRGKFEPPAQSPAIGAESFTANETIISQQASVDLGPANESFRDSVGPVEAGNSGTGIADVINPTNKSTTVLPPANPALKVRDSIGMQKEENELEITDGLPPGEIKKSQPNFNDQKEKKEWMQKELPLSKGKKEKYFVITNYEISKDSQVIEAQHAFNKTSQQELTSSATPSIKPIFKTKESIQHSNNKRGIFGEPPGAGLYNGGNKNGNLFNNHFEQETTQVIKVSIGQISVKAITPPPASKSTPVSRELKPALSLETYLKNRDKKS